MKVLWLDDMRNPFSAQWMNYIDRTRLYSERYEHYMKGNLSNTPIGEIYNWVKSYCEFVEWIKTNGVPDVVYFDHDLGEGKSGYDAAKYLIDYCIEHQIAAPEYHIQSSNPVGKANIESLFNSYYKIYGTD